MGMLFDILEGVRVTKIRDGPGTRRLLPSNLYSQVYEILELSGVDSTDCARAMADGKAEENGRVPLREGAERQLSCARSLATMREVTWHRLLRLYGGSGYFLVLLIHDAPRKMEQK